MAKHNFIVSLIKQDGFLSLLEWTCVSGHLAGSESVLCPVLELLVYETEVRGNYTSIFQTYL